MTVFLCNLNGQVTLVTDAVTASCASEVGRCPPRWTTWHKMSVWATPVGSPHMNQHHSVAALHQPNTISVGPSVASPGGEVGMGDVLPQRPGVCQCSHLLHQPQPQAQLPSGEPLQPWRRAGFSLPAAEIPLPVPTLTGLVICPQKCCCICLA